MKNYTITVNGNVYDVTVEEGASTGAPVAAPKAAAPAPAAAPKAAAPAKSGAAGSVKVNAPMPGKILAVKANAGDKVTKGQVIFVLEAMKMENELTAEKDAVVKRVFVTVDDVVGTDAPLIEFEA